MNADKIASLTGAHCADCLKSLNGRHPRKHRAIHTRLLRRRLERDWKKDQSE